MGARLVSRAMAGAAALVLSAACGEDSGSAPTQPDACVPSTCASLGKQCGAWSDGCGGDLACGSCATGHACADGQCGSCKPWSCETIDRQCGTWSDGCGGMLECGTCPAGSSCQEGRCDGPCTLVSHEYSESPPLSSDKVEIAGSAKTVAYYCPSDPGCVGGMGESEKLVALTPSAPGCSEWQFLYSGSAWFMCAGQKLVPAAVKIFLRADEGKIQYLCATSEVTYDPATGQLEVDCHPNFAGSSYPAPSVLEAVFAYQDAASGSWYIFVTAYQSLSCP